MANLIRFKKNTTSPTSSTAAKIGEPLFHYSSDGSGTITNLFMGYADGNNSVRHVGARIDDDTALAGNSDDRLVTQAAIKAYVDAQEHTPETADISDVSVTQTELAQLETLGSTTIEAADWTAVAAMSGTNSGDEPDASATVKGIVELATTSEATTGTDTARAVTPAGLQAGIDALIASAPGALDTLNELAAAIGDDANYAATITTALALKSTIASPTFTGTIAVPNVANVETAITANTAKVTNVTTNLAITGTAEARTITSSDGTDAIVPVATTSVSGVMNTTMFDQLAALEALTLSGSNTGDEAAASTTVAGVIELATDAEMTTGTATNRAITPANAKVELDKKSLLAGSSSIVTIGTLTGGLVGAAYGGTGIANNAASTIAVSGNYATTFTVTGTTGVTLPTSGTVLTSASEIAGGTYTTGGG